MTNDRRIVLKAASLGLSYPEETLKEAFGEVRAALRTVPAALGAAQVEAVLAHLENRPMLELQAHYTAVFDLNPAASLNLTDHAVGDREERGMALAGLVELYRRAGYDLAVNELPDYLPLVLEFLAESPGAERDPMLARCLAALPTVAAALDQKASVYAGLFEVLCGLFQTRGPGPARDELSKPQRGL